MTSANKRYLAALIAVIVLGLGAYGVTKAFTTTINSDTTIQGDYAVKSGRKLIIKNAAKLTVEGNFNSLGTIDCDGGHLVIIVKGSANINGKINCTRTENNSISGIMMAVGGSLNISQDAKISSNRSIQLVAKPELFADTPEKIHALYEEAAKDSGNGNRIGPFVEGQAAPLTLTNRKSSAILRPSNIAWPANLATNQSFGLIKTAAAKAPVPPPVIITGKIEVATPPRNIRQIVVFNFPDASGIQIQDFELTGPNGNNGEDDKNNSCNATGQDGQDAMRFLALAGDITVNNFTLKLGSGGRGGDAETQTDCYPKGTATAGRGGGSGNFKMISSGGFDIEGAFTVVPGKSGDGGDAIAHGKDADAPEQKGGDATAKGGTSADNKKSFSVGGTVGGVDNIQFASIEGGNGGSAWAYAGKGGDGKGCKSNGGPGGDATATAGKGGAASLSVSGGATRTLEAEDRGGNGGSATAHAGNGGNGGDCNPTGPGGNGGNGGNSTAAKGSGGTGTTTNGQDGSDSDRPGGNGGNGGSGCGPGNGGTGGSGDPKGKDGQPGKNLCVEEKKQDSQTSGDHNQTEKIQVIEYNGKYLPVDQLITESEKGCDGGQAHWHAKTGVVTATDGTKVADPGPQCGYGRRDQKPIMEVEIPKTSVNVETNVDTNVGPLEIRTGN